MQWLTEKHYLVCPKGVMFKQMKVMSQRMTYFSGHLAATTMDTMIGNAFMCMGNLAVAAPPVSALQSKAVAVMVAPGVGIPRLGIPPQLMMFASGPGTMKCNLSAPTRKWIASSPNLVINNFEALVVGQSKLMCPSEAVVIDAKETFWDAMISNSRYNLGNISAFACGVLAGRGLGRMDSKSPVFLSDGLNMLSRSVTGTSVYNGHDRNGDSGLLTSGTEMTISMMSAKGATLTCFPAGTLVHTNRGLLPIEQVTADVLLWTMNEETHERELKAIKTIHRRTALTMMVVELETDTLFEVTPDHVMMVNGAWKEAKELVAGDALEDTTGLPVVVRNAGMVSRSVVVYNFSMVDNENYFVTKDGVLVHNASYPF